jgi:AcrR family transcriptional regulator
MKSSATQRGQRPRGRPRTFDRNAALCAALRVFREHGYEGATLAELQEAMGGLSPPSLYAAFGSKEELFKEAVATYRDSIAKVTVSALEAPGVSTREAIASMLRATVAHLTKSGEPRGCLIVLGATQCSKESENVSEHLREMRVKTQDIIRARIKRGVTEGDVPKKANIEAMATFITTFGHGLSIQARDGATRTALNAAVECALAAWDKFVGSSE